MSIGTYSVIAIHHAGNCLYGELIQQMPERRTCWVRPLSLRLAPAASAVPSILDVRDGPDIICADKLIQPVLDTEWMQVIENMTHTKVTCDYPKANQYLREFLTDLLSQ